MSFTKTKLKFINCVGGFYETEYYIFKNFNMQLFGVS